MRVHSNLPISASRPLAVQKAKPANVMFLYISAIQYVVLGPRVKIIILNILPESKRSKLTFSLRKAFMFLAVTLKWQVSTENLNIFLVIRKKVTVLAGPWSANVVLGPRMWSFLRESCNSAESTCESQ